MDSDSWRLVFKIFEEAVELQGKEREELLDLRCGDDSEIRTNVESLLRDGEIDDEFLKSPGLWDSVGLEAPSPGQKIGELELKEEIGRGGMGVVYRAHQHVLRKDVAVKRLFSDAQRPGELDRIVAEARMAAKLNHPGIVPIHWVEQREGTSWLVMDLVDGRDLHREIEWLAGREELPPGESSVLPLFHSREYFIEVAKIISRAAAALHHAHEHNVVHRDVKPHNIIVDRDRNPHWVDFGLARDLRFGAGKTGHFEGTVYYVSPEQAEVSKKQKVDCRTDVYSLGIVLYELLTLARPFQGDSVHEVLHALRTKEVSKPRSLNPRVPKGLERICLKAIQKHPDDRYSTAALLAQDLEHFAYHEPLDVDRGTVRDSTRRLIRRYKRKVAVIGLLIFGTVLGLWLKSLLLVPSTYASVSVIAVDTNGEELEDAKFRVSILKFDALAGTYGLREPFAEGRVDSRYVDPGFFRFVVDYPDGSFTEHFRYLKAGAANEVRSTYNEEISEEGMVFVEGGSFQLKKMPENSLCPHVGQVAQMPPFWIDANEVTNDQYRKFIQATGRAEPIRWKSQDWDKNWNEEWNQLPVSGISWMDARAYAEWMGKRLPTLLEWWLVAMGTEGRTFPWGNELLEPGGNVSGERKSYHESPKAEFDEYLKGVVSVELPTDDATPDLVYHLRGNVIEFVESPVVNPEREVMPDVRYIMGGSWAASQMKRTIRKYGFIGISRASQRNDLGFRCVRTAPSSEIVEKP